MLCFFQADEINVGIAWIRFSFSIWIFMSLFPFFCCSSLDFYILFLFELLKSVHFKKTVAQSSFLSKLWYFLIQQQQVPQFWKKWGSCNCLLKMNGLYFFSFSIDFYSILLVYIYFYSIGCIVSFLFYWFIFLC